jgi:hypothetical protein
MIHDKTVSLVLRAAAIATLLIGLAILFFPQLIVYVFDGYSGSNYHFMRFIGTALLGFALMNWLYAGFHDKKAVMPALLGNLVSLGIAVVVDIIGLVQGSVPMVAAIILLLHVIFMVAFGYAVWLIRQD